MELEGGEVGEREKRRMRKRERGNEKREERREQGLKICFWNIAGVLSKCEEMGLFGEI